ncbi:uncharacterized protein LOC144142455 [Haemaphysalis longicornis]
MDVRSQPAARSEPVTVSSSGPPSPRPCVTHCPLIPRPVYLAAVAKLADVKNNFRALLRDNQTGVDLVRVAQLYQDKFGCPLSFVPFGCNTLEQFVRQELGDTVHMEQDSTGAYRVTLLRDGSGTPKRRVIEPWQQRRHGTYGARASPAVRRSPPPESPEEDWEAEIVPCPPEAEPSAVADVHAGGDTRVNGTGPLSPQLVSNIKKVVDARPGGLWLSEFDDAYWVVTGHHLPLWDYGFSSVLELVPHCADIVTITRPIPEGEFMICPREQPPTSKPPSPYSEPPAQRCAGHQQPQRPQAPPLDFRHMMDVVEKIIRDKYMPPRGRGRGTRAACHQPGATTPGGLTRDALHKAFSEATGHRLDPGVYGFSDEAFVYHICLSLSAKCPESSGQLLLRLGADLLASPPQPRTRPRCIPDNVWGSVEPRGQGSATGMQEPGVQGRGRAQLVPAVPDVLARRAVPLQPCPPSDRALEEEGTERPSSRASQPPAAAPGAEGLPQLSLDPIGQQPLAPPVDLEGPFQLCDKLGEESTLVYISHVYTLHHFYVQCVDEDTVRTLQWLAVHLEAVSRGRYQGAYQNDGQALCVGMPCTAPYTCSDGETAWLRGMVYAFDAKDENYAHVFFVDYGYASRVRRTDLHPLKNECASIPAQAIRATMGHLEPVGADWSREAMETFIHLLGKERTVMCTLLEHRGSICSVHLCNTCVDPEVHIPDAMVDLGHAASVLTDEELPEEPEEPVTHVLVPAESAPAASASSLSSPTGSPSFSAPLRGRPASPPTSHAPQVVPIHGASTSDVLEQGVGDIEQRLGALLCLERQDLPVEPEEPAADPLQGPMRLPSPRQPVFSLLPLTSGSDFQGPLDALHASLTPSEGSLAREEEEPEGHITRPPLLSPEPVMQPSREKETCPGPLRGIPSTGSDSTEAWPIVHGPQATVQSCAPVREFREAPLGRHPFSRQSSPSPPGWPSLEPSWGPGPSTGVVQQPPPGLSTHVPGDFELGARPRALPVHQQGSDAQTAQPALPLQEEQGQEATSWQGLPLIQPEPGLGTLYPRHAVKLEYLRSGHCLSVVNLHREPYVTSANLCQLLGWPLDTLVQELQDRHSTIGGATLKRDNCLRLFYQMAGYDVPGVTGPIWLAKEVTLFRLKDVIDLLDVFQNTDNVLRAEVDRVQEAFDPESPYWTVGPPLLQAGTSADPGAGSGGAGPP